jgi:hypothetical protein
MTRTVAYLLLLYPALCLGADRFLLQTELRTTYTGAFAAKSFTGYNYNASGNRIARRVFDGVDSSSALMSRELFTYDADSRLSQDLLLSATGDTLSIVRNTYGSGGLICAATLKKDGSVRFTDSLIYSGAVLAEQRRYNSSATMTYFHRYAYVSGLLCADSLFEPDGANGFAATQALLISRNADSTVAREAQWRKSSDLWYPVGITKMTYTQKLLVSAATYEADGSSGALTDSLAYAYDAHGNKIKESSFSDDKTLVYEIASIWFDTQPIDVLAFLHAEMPVHHVAFRNGRISFGAPFTGTVTVYSAAGCKVTQLRFDKSESSLLGFKAASGRYFATANGTLNQTFSFVLNK